MGKKRGLQIWVSDYAPNKQIAKDIIILNKANGFIPFATNSDDNIFNSIPSFSPQPIDVNPKNVTGLKIASNFLYLTDSSNFDKQEDFVLALSNTNYDAVTNPKIHKIIQDGRNHLLTTSKTYDVITAEPPPPTNAGAVNLYTKEYYELTKKALNPGGIVSQWIPLHSQTETHIYEHFRTFFESFPYVMSWYPTKQELILIGSNDPINIDFKKIEKRLKHPVVNEVMRKIKFENPFTLSRKSTRLNSSHW